MRAALIGLSALTVNPLRTVLSTLGVIIGVAALVAILALGDGLERFSREQLESTTDFHTVTVSAETTLRIDGIAVRRDSVMRFGNDDLESLRARVGTRARIFRVLTGSATFRPPDSTRQVGLLVRAVDADAPLADRSPLLHGDLAAFLPDTDPMPVVLSRATAEAMFAGRIGSAPGQSLRLDGRTVRVAAVLDGSATARPLEIFVPYDETAVAWLGADGRPVSIVLRAGRIEDVDDVTLETEAWAGERFPEGAVSVASSRARVRQAGQALMVFKLGLASIAAISLIVGGIGIMNILLASVSERTREIGIRKSVGARALDIRRQFLAESIAIAGVGSAIGIVLGMGGALAATAIIRTLTEAPVHAAFTWPSIAVAAVAAIVVGVVFGTYPARKAGRLSPIDAIRHE